FGIDVGSGDVGRVVDGGTVSAFDVAGDTIALTRNALDTGHGDYTARAGAEDGLRQIKHADGERRPCARLGGHEQCGFLAPEQARKMDCARSRRPMASAFQTCGSAATSSSRSRAPTTPPCTATWSNPGTMRQAPDTRSRS